MKPHFKKEQKMGFGIPEIAIIVVILVVLFGGAKIIGDKRYLKRSGKSSASIQDKKDE